MLNQRLMLSANTTSLGPDIILQNDVMTQQLP